MRTASKSFKPGVVSLATAYTDQSAGEDAIEIPETFDGMDYAAVQELHGKAVEAFEGIYADAEGDMTPEQIEQLSGLADSIEALSAEITQRDAEKAERAEKAAELAARVKGTAGDEGEALSAETSDDEAPADEDEASAEGEETDETDADADADGENTSEDEGAAETVVASAAKRKAMRVPMPKRRAPQAPAPEKASVKDVAFNTSEGTGYAVGAGVDFLDMAKAVDRKLMGYNGSQYSNAAKMGRKLNERHSIASFKREFSSDLTIKGTDQEQADAVFTRAVDESRLPQGSLVASGGWCAPSETLYDTLELESRDGLLSLPEVGVSRGGIQFTPGVSFADIYANITGFNFTEQDDIDGAYEPGAEGNVVGPKPCYHIECPPFEDARLEVSGLCLTAGLLQRRGYPEHIARVLRGALTAHEHRVNAQLIQRIIAGSDAVTLPATQAGTAAPVLTAIELQVEHYKYTHRLPRTASLEAVFPFWVRGAIRSDLSRRLGVDLLAVTDAQIDGWFRQRGINPQFVYNWQNLDTTAGTAFTAWPTEVSFLLYAAGTWVRGSNDIITLDTIYDSTLLSNNDYTALFTEEGWLVAKRGTDSRLVSTSIEADGATHMGIEIEHNGTKAAAAAG